MKNALVPWKALLLSLLAYSLWSTCDAIVKIGGQDGLSAFQIAFFISSFSLSFIIGYSGLQRNFKTLWPKNPKMVMLRSVLSASGMLLFYTAYTRVPLADAYIIEFIAPFLIAIGATLFFGEAFSLNKMGLILIGFCGIYIAVDPQLLFSDQELLIGYGGALGGTFVFVLIQLLSRHLSTKENPLAILFLGNITNLLGALLMAKGQIPYINAQTLLFLMGGAFCGLSGSILMITSFKHGSTDAIASLHYWQFVMGILYGYFLFQTVPTADALIGGGIVIASGIAMVHLEKKKGKKHA